MVSFYLFTSVALRALNEWHDADRCLDDGGSFDYTIQSCDTTENHPYIPYSGRHPQDLQIAKASLLLLAAFSFVFLSTGPAGLTILRCGRYHQTRFAAVEAA